jgi:hypothetical protein
MKVYVVSLQQSTPSKTFLEVFESRRDALERAASWAGMILKEVLASTDEELEDFVNQQTNCLVQPAEFYPRVSEFDIS